MTEANTFFREYNWPNIVAISDLEVYDKDSYSQLDQAKLR